jgi:hypothetical protein
MAIPKLGVMQGLTREVNEVSLSAASGAIKEPRASRVDQMSVAMMSKDLMDVRKCTRNSASGGQGWQYL